MWLQCRGTILRYDTFQAAYFLVIYRFAVYSCYIHVFLFCFTAILMGWAKIGDNVSFGKAIVNYFYDYK